MYTDNNGHRFIYLFCKQQPTVICSDNDIIDKFNKIFLSDLTYIKM